MPPHPAQPAAFHAAPALLEWPAIREAKETMRQALRRRTALVCALVTLVWLAAGTGWFVHWQASEGVAASAGQMWREAFEAALLVALIFWVLAGIAYGVIIWIVTGRGPQA
jgi:hypothetical protein